jgi:hypothetical protein
MMRNRLRFMLCLGLLLGVFMAAVPASAQNYTATGACGLGRYWLMQDNSWDGVLIRREDSATFDGFGALWSQPDGTATFNINISGDAVTIDRIDNPNPFGTTTCSYQGTVRPDGVSVVGTTRCQVNGVTSLALSWSAQIVCDVPEITWNDTAFWHRAAKGQQFTFLCPYDGFRAPVWGTDVYIEGSSICAAAVHAGAITPENGGPVTIEILPGEASYPGSTRNGITSDTFPTPGQFNASFRVIGGQDAGSSGTSNNTLPASGSVPGVWQTDFGVITIGTDGYGTYDDFGEPSHITFTHTDPQTIDGYWVEQSSQRECDTEMNGSRHWGRLHVVFDPAFNTFRGVWGYCNDEPSTGWSGFRTDQQPAAAPTSTPAPRWDNFMGTWNTSYGVIELDGSGVATYPGPEPSVPSHMYFQQDDAHTISGYWVQPGSSVKCSAERYGSYYWGRIRWTFDENFAKFTGLWAYCEDEPNGYWGGDRVP